MKEIEMSIAIELGVTASQMPPTRADEWARRTPYWLKSSTVVIGAGEISTSASFTFIQQSTVEKLNRWTNSLATLTWSLCLLARLKKDNAKEPLSIPAGKLVDALMDRKSIGNDRSALRNASFLEEIFPLIWQAKSDSTSLSGIARPNHDLVSTSLFVVAPARKDRRNIAIVGHVDSRISLVCSVKIDGVECSTKTLTEICEGFESARSNNKPTRNRDNQSSPVSKPSPFSVKVQQAITGFTGRDWLYRDFDEFIQSGLQSPFPEKRSGYYCLVAPPGIGKTAICAQLIYRRNYAHHLFSKGIYGTYLSLITSIYGHFSERYLLTIKPPTPSDCEPPKYMTALLSEVSGKLEAGELEVLVIDALDEVVDSQPSGMILPPELPEGIFVFCTVRGSGEDAIRFPGGAANLRIRDYSGFGVEHQEDVEAYVAHCVQMPELARYAKRTKTTLENLKRQLLRRSQMNFMYLKYVIPEIASGNSRFDKIDQLPDGLKNYYATHWDFMHASDEKAWYGYRRSVIVILSLSQSPVSLEMISAYASVSEELSVRAAEKGINDYKRFLLEDFIVDNQGARVKAFAIYHPHFQEYVRRRARDSSENGFWEAICENMASLQCELFIHQDDGK